MPPPCEIAADGEGRMGRRLQLFRSRGTGLRISSALLP
jgi:hypothetical protein